MSKDPIAQKLQAIVKVTHYSPQPNGNKALWLKTPLTYVIEQGEINLVPH